MRPQVIAAGVALTVAAVATAGVLSTGGHSQPPVARSAPFTLAPVAEGAPEAALSATPNRPTVLSFFAAWCEPCRRELPLLEAAAAQRGGPDVVGVDFLDQRADALDLLARARVTFPTGYDHDGEIGRRWAVDGLPVTVFIAPGGRVVDYHRGELRRPELDRLVGRLETSGR